MKEPIAKKCLGIGSGLRELHISWQQIYPPPTLRHQRWQIFVRTSWKASARLYTKRAPHLASEELAWHVYTGGKFAAWPEEEAECFPVEQG